MNKPIKFIYAALIVTFVGALVSLVLVWKIEHTISPINTVSSSRVDPSTLKTSIYAGTYGYDTDPSTIERDKNGDIVSSGPAGSVIVYPADDTTIVFYLDKNRGAPSYNMGQTYGGALLKDGSTNIFRYDNSDVDYPCVFDLSFGSTSLTITTVGGAYEGCGFGNGIIADGEYPKKTSTIPEIYTDGQGDTHYFSKE